MRIIFNQTGSNPRFYPGPPGLEQPGERRRETVIIVRGTGGDGGGKKVYQTSDEAVERDSHVRGHENAHLSALGPYAASGVLYTTVKGAEGETIAVGGRIAVDLAEVPGDPAATLRKARVVFNAAGAPGDPSAADLRVAARAYRLMQKAQAELRVEKYA